MTIAEDGSMNEGEFAKGREGGVVEMKRAGDRRVESVKPGLTRLVGHSIVAGSLYGSH